MNTTAQPAPPDKGRTIRPADDWRDLPIILDLIEIGFDQELDPQGRKIIKQTRKMLRTSTVSRLILGYNADASGLVCEIEGEVVGNVSLRRASPNGTGRMIGNVVVRPEYRGQGIARDLMERAINAAKQQGAGWIGLEVREGNLPACKLYEHLGFRTVGRTLHYLRPAKCPWPAVQKSRLQWQRSRPSDAEHWLNLAEAIFPPAQRDILEIRKSAYRYGDFERNLSLRLSRQVEQAWLFEDNEPQIAVHTKIDKHYRFHVWDIFLHRNLGASMAEEAVNKALSRSRRFPAWAVIAQIADQPPLSLSLEARDFHLHRTLLQMKLNL